MAEDTCKTCSTCGQEKSLAEFYRDRTRRDGYDYKCKPCKNRMVAAYPKERRAKQQRTYRRNNREVMRQHWRNWRDRDPVKAAYCAQKARAKVRGIEWEITLDEFRDFWRDKWHLRGKTKNSLVMARKGDKGPYRLDNVVPATMRDNSRRLV